jgi:hypothetical protein
MRGLWIEYRTADTRSTMDAPATTPDEHTDGLGAAAAVLAHVRVTWDGGTCEAAVLHTAGGLLVLEATDGDASLALPAAGTDVQVSGETVTESGRMAEVGRGGRFLVSVGDRAVRRSLRLRVSLPCKLRGGSITDWMDVELADLTTGGARVRGVELPVGTQVTLGFTPPGRPDPVTVRGLVVHGTHGGQHPWMGVAFRLVALRGGR